MLDRLKQNNLYGKLSKCEWGVKEVQFLGYLISEKGLRITPEHTKAVMDFPLPETVLDLQKFLGLANYFHIFSDHLATAAGPLHALVTKADSGKKRPLTNWTAIHTEAFDKVKTLIVTAPVLRPYDASLPTKVKTDASGYAIGSVLLQNDGAGWRPVAFHSCKLLGAETRYDTREQELLSIHEALVQWHAYLEGIKFTVETDHESLKWLQDQRILNR